MAITIFGITLGGEAAKKKEAASIYAIKYPNTGNINELRQNLGRATIELSALRSQNPQSAADKRTQQRNITALTTQTINLQNAINDANLGIGNVGDNYKLKLPNIGNFTLKSPYSGGSSKPLIKEETKKTTVIKGGLPETITKEEVIVDNTDGGEPQLGNDNPQFNAKGDYPPPQGVQGTNYGKWIGLSLLGVGVVTTTYILLTKKK